MLTTVAGVFCAMAKEGRNNTGKINRTLISKFFKDVFAGLVGGYY
jgi:hypothetical protein